MKKFILSYKNKKMIYSITKKDIKNINLRINREGVLVVSAPFFVREKEVIQFIESKSSWIYKHIIKIEENPLPKIIYYETGDTLIFLGEKYLLEVIENTENGIKESNVDKKILLYTTNVDDIVLKKEIYEYFLKVKAKKIFKGILEEMYELVKPLGVEFPKMTIRSMKTRWGSCSYTKNRITINLKLIYKPIDLIELVILHELIHFIHHNHSKDFYSLFEKLMPDYKDREKLLKNKK